MYIRCPGCWSSTRIQSGPRGIDPHVFCERCGLLCTLEDTERLNMPEADVRRDALAYAQRRRIDLASASSVLLGLMTLDQAFLIRDGRLPVRDVGRPPAKPKAASSQARTQPTRVAARSSESK